MLNGVPVAVAYEGETNLLEVLRRRVGLTAAKNACGEGLERVSGRTVVTTEGRRGRCWTSILCSFWISWWGC